jgi:hypothetical protein
MSEMVTLLTLMFAPRVVVEGTVERALLETITSAPEPGTSTCTAAPLVSAQLLAVMPSDAAHTLAAPERPPVQ